MVHDSEKNNQIELVKQLDITNLIVIFYYLLFSR